MSSLRIPGGNSRYLIPKSDMNKDPNFVIVCTETVPLIPAALLPKNFTSDLSSVMRNSKKMLACAEQRGNHQDCRQNPDEFEPTAILPPLMICHGHRTPGDIEGYKKRQHAKRKTANPSPTAVEP